MDSPLTQEHRIEQMKMEDDTVINEIKETKTPEKIVKLKDTFKDYIKPNPNEYIDTFIQKDDLTISIYKSKKVLFQGNDAIFYGSAFLDTKFSNFSSIDTASFNIFPLPVIFFLI